MSQPPWPGQSLNKQRGLLVEHQDFLDPGHSINFESGLTGKDGLFVIVQIVRHPENFPLIFREEDVPGLDGPRRGRPGPGRISAPIRDVIVLDLTQAAGAVVNVARDLEEDLEKTSQ